MPLPIQSNFVAHFLKIFLERKIRNLHFYFMTNFVAINVILLAVLFSGCAKKNVCPICSNPAITVTVVDGVTVYSCGYGGGPYGSVKHKWSDK
jgi:hypothetical protein